MATSSSTRLLSTTLDNYRKTLTDNVFKARVLLWWLTEKNRVRKLSGGVTIVEPLIYAEGQAGSYGEWDAIQIVPQEGISAAEYPWRQLFATIAISGLEEAQNNGEEAVINLLDAKVMQAEETMKTKLNRMLYADGTGNSGKDFLGLALLVGATGTASVASTPPTPATPGGVPYVARPPGRSRTRPSCSRRVGHRVQHGVQRQRHHRRHLHRPGGRTSCTSRRCTPNVRYRTRRAPTPGSPT